MLFTYEQKRLQQLLTRFSHVVGAEKSHIPTLSHVRVEVQDDKVIFSGTDQEITLTEIVATNEGNKVGQCTFPVRSLLDLVKNLSPTKPIKIELLADKKLQVRQGRSRFAFGSYDPTTFPSFSPPDIEFTPVDPESLVEAISAVDYAVFADESRGALGGVYLEPTEEEGFMRTVASDGRRLATCKVPGILKDPIVISKKGANAIKKILPISEEASMLTDNNFLYLALDKGILGVRLIASTFPNYKAAFPQGGHNLINLDRSDTILTLKRICLFTEDKNSGHTTIKVGKESLELTVRTQKGDAVEEIQYLPDSELNSELELQLNPLTLQQSLEKFKGEKVSVRIYSNLSPILIFDKENAMALVMPQKK